MPLFEFIAAVERAVGRPANKVLLPMQPGDVPATYADVDRLERLTGARPNTPLVVGVERFVQWYRGYFGRPAASA